ncbi:diguanylate cyclase/phosphodiesterase with PAS/PAC sensor(s), partial [mine drainage metagenome]
LVTLLREPVVCNDIPLSLQPGVGLLEIGPEDLTEREILRRAMSASHAAMRKQRAWLRYDASYDELQRREFFLITELAIAVRAGTDLALHYQPRIELEGGTCVGFEALIRWRHPTEGWILPATFIPLAERSGLIRILTNWVLDTAARQLAAWRDTPQASLRIGVNIASADLDFDLIRRVLQVSEQHCIDPGSLEVEFTETTLLEYGLDTQTHLATLRGLGVGIAIDDFGTGFSNLAMLRQMSADTLKIDQSFVRQMCESAQDQIMVKAICEIARDMKFRVVAEGVETADVLEALKGMACDEIQGYLLAKPMPADELLPWLARHEPARWKR